MARTLQFTAPAQINSVKTLAGPVTYTAQKHYNYFTEAVTRFVNGKQTFVGLSKPKSVPALPL